MHKGELTPAMASLTAHRSAIYRFANGYTEIDAVRRWFVLLVQFYLNRI